MYFHCWKGPRGANEHILSLARLIPVVFSHHSRGEIGDRCDVLIWRDLPNKLLEIDPTMARFPESTVVEVESVDINVRSHLVTILSDASVRTPKSSTDLAADTKLGMAIPTCPTLSTDSALFVGDSHGDAD